MDTIKKAKPRRPRARTPKVSIDALHTWLREVGAVERERYERDGAVQIVYTLATTLGTLHVHPFPWERASTQGGAWIACRFEDVETARRHFGVRFTCTHRLNPYSGKWNFTEGLGADQGGVDLMLSIFRSEVSKLLPPRPAAPAEGA